MALKVLASLTASRLTSTARARTGRAWHAEQPQGSSWTKADLRISQELPGINPDLSARAFIVVDNVTNLLNDEWGVMYKPNFPYGVTQGDIDAGRAESRIGGALWEFELEPSTASNTRYCI